MVTNYLRVILIIGLAFLMQGCPFANLPCEGVDENRYIISNPGLITVYPEHTTFEVGDTIWIESTISTIQITNTGQQVDIYENLGLNRIKYEGFLFAKFDPSTNSPISVLAPELFIVNGFAEVFINTDDSQFHQLEYEYSNNEYNLNIGYILGESGNFSLYDPDLDRMRVVASIGNGCGETYSIYTTLANPNNGYAFEFEVSD